MEDFRKTCHNAEKILKYQNFPEKLREHFERESNQIPSNLSLPELTPIKGVLPKITEQEVNVALQNTKGRKTPGPDGISSDLLKRKEWRTELCQWLAEYFNKILDGRMIPSIWKKSYTIPAYKGKGSKDDCSNYRPIRLHCHLRKIFEKILESRIQEIVKISPNQYGYRKNFTSIEPLYRARSLLQEHLEKKSPLHMAFLDIERAFDSVSHLVIWHSLRDHQVPESLIDIVKILYEDHETELRMPFHTTESFPIKIGVHQGSALAPLLFITVMDTITKDLQKPIPWTMLYADDVILADTSREGLEKQVHQWKDQLEEFGLKLNMGKIGYLSTDIESIRTINIAGVDVKRTKVFKYLGSLIADDGNMNFEFEHRVQTYLSKWQEHRDELKKAPIEEKARIYRTKIRPKLFYGAECWTLTKEIEEKVVEAETKVLSEMNNKTGSMAEHLEIYGLLPLGDQIRERKTRWQKRLKLNAIR